MGNNDQTTKKGMSRRDFLQKSALAGCGVSSGWCRRSSAKTERDCSAVDAAGDVARRTAASSARPDRRCRSTSSTAVTSSSP